MTDMLGAITVATYDCHARALADYFAGNASHVPLIEQCLTLAGNPESARVVEVGCGDGRDAADIMSRVGWYEGL